MNVPKALSPIRPIRMRPYVVLAGCLALAAVASGLKNAWQMAKERTAFEAAANRAQAQFQRQVDTHLVLLDALRGLTHAKISMNRDQFAAFVDELQLPRRYPGVEGLGYAAIVKRSTENGTLAGIRDRTDPSFAIWPASDRDVRCPIVYLEPRDEARAGNIGYDLTEQKGLHAILLKAAQTGQIEAFIGSVGARGAEDERHRRIVMVAPAYREGAPPSTEQERLERVFGFLFCAFHLDTVLGTTETDTAYPELAHTLIPPPGVAVSSGNARSPAATAPTPAAARFSATMPLTIGERPWKLVLSAGEAQGGLSKWGIDPWWLLAGIGVSLAVFGATRANVKAKRDAMVHDKARREVEVHFQRLVEQSIVGIYLIQDDRLVYVNPRMAEIFGCSKAELMERPLLEFIAEESRDVTRNHVRRRLSGEVESVHYSLKGIRKDGSIVHLDAHGGRVEYNGRNAILGCLIDTTERAQTEQKLKDQLARLDLLRQTTRAVAERQDLQSIFQVTIRNLEDDLPIDFGCLCQRDAAQDLARITAIGMKHADLLETLALSSLPLDNGEAVFEKCLRGELATIDDLTESTIPFFQHLAKAGLRSIVMAPIHVRKVLFGILLVAREKAASFSGSDCDFLRQLSEHVALATQQAQLYTALEDAYNDLRATKEAAMQQERLRAVGQMASGIAHDVNNLIMPVCVYAELLLTEEEGLSGRAREYLEIVHRASCDIAATVGRLREVYHPRQPANEFQSVDLNEQIEHVLGVTRPRWQMDAQERGVSIIIEKSLAAPLPRVQAIESEVREALTNLVLNAIDAMPKGGVLKLRTDHLRGGGGAAGRVVLEVADTGCGMDAETKQRCLEPFFTTKGQRGTGLGLAMVFGIMERHSGELELESAPGEGTTFRLMFPAPELTLSNGAYNSAPAAPLGALRILVVDDDPILLKSLRTVLESDGHFVAAYGSGQAGIEAFTAAHRENTPFSLVISDLGMPQVDGRMLVAAVKKVSPDTPVILLTGFGNRLTAANEVPFGVTRVLSKPTKLHELRDALTACMARPEAPANQQAWS